MVDAQPTRRQLLLIVGLAVLPAMTRLDPFATADEMHAGLSTALAGVIDTYETADLADTAGRLQAIELMARRVMSQQRPTGAGRTDWQRLRGRTLTLLSDCAYLRGDHHAAGRWADMAAQWAAAAGDRTALGRATATHIPIARAARSPRVAVHAAARAYRAAGHSPAAVWAAASAGHAYADLGDQDGVQDAVGRAWGTLEALPDQARSGAAGVDLDRFAPARLALDSAEVLVRIGDLKAADRYLAHAEAEIDRDRVGMFGWLRVVQARVCLARRDPVTAAAFLRDGVHVSAHRPAAWLVRAVRELDRQAARLGCHELGDLVERTAGWS